MDLEIKDVSELLNVSEKTIKKWVDEGKIPAYKLENKMRFSRTEIENWMLDTKEKKDELISLKSDKAKKIVAKKIGTQAFSLFRALNKGSVITNIKGNTKEDVIRESVKVIAKNLSLDTDVLTELLLDREKLMPTALNHGVAVPHTRDFLLPQTHDVVSVVYLNKPIEYGALDGQKVKTLFFLFACDDKRHLHLLAKIAHLTRNEESLNFINEQPGKVDLLNFIKTWETTLGLEKVSS